MFLICDQLVIETKKNRFESCKFTIKSSDESWKYEKGSLTNNGTIIKMTLNEYGNSIILEDVLKKYFIYSDIPIFYKDINTEEKLLMNNWDFNYIINNYLPAEYIKKIDKETLIKIDKDEYNMLFGLCDSYRLGLMIIFNQGIFVHLGRLQGLNFSALIIVDLKKNIIDLNISKEKIIKNEKWNIFINKIFENLFLNIEEKYLYENPTNYVLHINSIIGKSIYTAMNYDELFDNVILLNNFFNNIFYPVLINKSISYIKIKDLMPYKKILHYQSRTNDFINEINYVLSNYPTEEIILFNVYKLPEPSIKPDNYNTLCYKLDMLNIKYTNIALIDCLCKQYNIVTYKLNKIIPDNIKFVKYEGTIKPISIIGKRALLESNTIEITQFIAKMTLFINMFSDTHFIKSVLRARPVDIVNIKLKPIIYINSEDEFIKKIEKLCNYDDNIIQYKIINYIKHLAIFTIIARDRASFYILTNIIDNYEKEIAELLNINKPEPILLRLNDENNLYLNYITNQNYKFYNIN